MLENIDTFIDYYRTFISALFAGLCISIGCIVNLMVGGGIAGAVLFTFGLITVVHYKYYLYTGTAGFVNHLPNIIKLFLLVLIGNIVGCIITSLAIRYAIPELVEKANSIVDQRNSVDIWQAGIRGILCGYLMTTAVEFARKEKWLPILFAVPVFILAGFYHSIADAFYISLSNNIEYCTIWNYIFIVIGNFIGCNLYKARK